VGDGDVNTNGDSGGVGGGDEVDDHVQRTALRVVGDAIFWFTLNVVGSTGKASERGEEQEDGVQSVADVIVERGFAFFGEPTGEKVITVGVAGLFAVGAGEGGGRGEKGEAELAAEEEAVRIRREAMVREAAREGVHGDARGRREQRGEDVKRGRIEGLAAVEEGSSGEVVVELALEAAGRRMEDEVRGGEGAGGGEKRPVVDVEEWREVVAECADEGSRVAGRLPRGEPLGVDGGKFVCLIAIAVRDPLGGIADRADEGDEECR
jgi:hypothetical protein